MIYLDHHATTPLDPVALDAMLPWMKAQFGNPHSHTHALGRQAKAACDEALENLARLLGTSPESIVVTSGATESNNLAIDGVMRHPRQRRARLITCTTEHPAVLDPCLRWQKEAQASREVVVLSVRQQADAGCGQIDLKQLRDELQKPTALVSIMWANNEIGTIQPIKQIAEIVHEAGALLHCDATQAAGRQPIDIDECEIDLLSASAHKFYGPKGVGLLALNSHRRIRINPILVGGGQQQGLRSGTINVAGLIGLSIALQTSVRTMTIDNQRQQEFRNRLWQQLRARFPDLLLNGPALDDPMIRLVNNLNFSFVDVEGETIMAAAGDLAISSGSACSSVDPRPSHVLTAIGLSESRARRSLRMGLGRFTTADEIDGAVQMIADAYSRVVTG